MNRKHHPQLHISGLWPVLTLGIFALCLVLVLLTGGRIYAGLQQDGGLHHARRTAAMYLTTRLGQSAGFYAEDFGGTQALTFPEEIGGEGYITRIYCYDGWLRELFSRTDGDFSPEDGEKLLEMTEFSATIEGKLIRIRFSLPGGETEEVLYSIREVAYEP